jgi:toxin-antitoxin system PIN domain toxin
MSATVDTNVLVYATNTSAPEYVPCRALLSRLVDGPALTTLFWPVLIGFLRIATHPAIFRNPLSAETAESAIDQLLLTPSIRVVGEDDRFWQNYRGLAASRRPAGNLVPDAAIVAMMAAHGVRTIYTRDRYFRQFDDIQVIDPTSV